MEEPKQDEPSDAPESRDAFLAGPPRSGELSPFGQKLATEVFVWLASMVVFGSTINFRNTSEQCTPLCNYAIATGALSAILTTCILLAHFFTGSNKLDRNTWFTSRSEMHIMSFLSIWWAAGVGGLSAIERSDTKIVTPVNHASGIGIFFGWLAFFGSIYGWFKAYHASKEEQRSLNYAQHFPYSAPEEEEHFANF